MKKKKGRWAWVDDCPYCNYELKIDEVKVVAQCPKCKKVFEIKWDLVKD